MDGQKGTVSPLVKFVDRRMPCRSARGDPSFEEITCGDDRRKTYRLCYALRLCGNVENCGLARCRGDGSMDGIRVKPWPCSAMEAHALARWLLDFLETI